MSLILCLPFLRLKTSAATLMPSLMPVPTRASDPDKRHFDADDEFLAARRTGGQQNRTDQCREQWPKQGLTVHESFLLRLFYRAAAIAVRASAIFRNCCLSTFPVAEAGNAGSMTISAGRL